MVLYKKARCFAYDRFCYNSTDCNYCICLSLLGASKNQSHRMELDGNHLGLLYYNLLIFGSYKVCCSLCIKWKSLEFGGSQTWGSQEIVEEDKREFLVLKSCL